MVFITKNKMNKKWLKTINREFIRINICRVNVKLKEKSLLGKILYL